MAVGSLLLKSVRLLEQAKARQPIDPLASLTAWQRNYFQAWRIRFFEAHSNPKEPGSLFAAFLQHKGWTPFEWLGPSTQIMEAMTETAAESAYRSFMERMKHNDRN